MSGMEGWQFAQHDGGWVWIHIDPATEREIERAQAAFRTLIECVSDAREHGYAFPPTDLRR